MGQSCGQAGSHAAFFTGAQPGRADNEAYGLEPIGWRNARPKDDREQEPRLPLHAGRFHVSVVSGSDQAVGSRQGWRSHYALGPMLGDGVSATVYEAEALTTVPHSLTSSSSAAAFLGRCGRLPPCLVERGRRVAIKRFHRAGSRTFKKELLALQKAGVFPHILRLLESFEACDGEDVLVLEYCDGSTVYDLYAREHPHGGLPERLVARLVRQLLLALEHLAACGVEHQDVKPENMMLYDVSVQNCQAELKLGDFGWAAIITAGGNVLNKPPATGAGSLWYAPPELNPPVPGMERQPGLVDNQGNPVRGRSDMWSVGVVAYLLLVGHNPFNAALRLPNPSAVDNEVMRLAVRGDFNRKSDKWTKLHQDAREFITALLQVRPNVRPIAAEALAHQWLTRRTAKGMENSVFFHGPVTNLAERETAWSQLDGMQQLGWLAVARAVAEPELDRQVVATALECMRPGSNAGVDAGASKESLYLRQLARELGTAPVCQWLQDRPAWAEIMRLAFTYLDVDCDGLLGPQDVVAHTLVAPQREAAATIWGIVGRWIARWQDPDMPATTTASGHVGLPMSGFRMALMASHANVEDTIFDAFDSDTRGVDAAGGRGGDDSADLNHPSFSNVPNGSLPDHQEEEISWPKAAAAALQSTRAMNPLSQYPAPTNLHQQHPKTDSQGSDSLLPGVC